MSGASPANSPLASRFERFDAENPLLYATMVRLAHERVALTGCRKLSVREVFTIAKWETEKLTGSEIQCNNDFHSFYSRKIMAHEPDLRGLFEVRSSEADGWTPTPVQTESSNGKAVDLESAPVLDAEQARRLTDRIKVSVEGLWDLIKAAYLGRAWTALGYESWDTYCSTEFDSVRLRLPREERREAVCSLRESGLSIRAIASATGVDRNTVRSDLSDDSQVGEIHPPDEPVDADTLIEQSIEAEVVDAEVVENALDKELIEAGVEPKPEPKPVTGIDGKTYKPKGPKTGSRKGNRTPITTVANKLAMDLDKATSRVKRITDDDRPAQNKDKVAAYLRHYLIQMIDACQELDHHINS